MLFSSNARGDYTDLSDYDVLIVGGEIPRDPRKVPDDLYMSVVKMYPGEVDPVFMDMEVFMKKLKEGVTFILRILEEGKVRYRDEEFSSQVVRAYSEARPTYVRKGKDRIIVVTKGKQVRDIP
ncbi:nucleotidyltransferase domain-containing protein [Sulfodiicoccus acidiphilus]|nr:nucleotidyltransferase domain-containing protein [Sulfodiicoccus acidiphilus]